MEIEIKLIRNDLPQFLKSQKFEDTVLTDFDHLDFHEIVKIAKKVYFQDLDGRVLILKQ